MVKAALFKPDTGDISLHEFIQYRPVLFLQIYKMHPHHIVVIRWRAGCDMRLNNTSDIGHDFEIWREVK